MTGLLRFAMFYSVPSLTADDTRTSHRVAARKRTADEQFQTRQNSTSSRPSDISMAAATIVLEAEDNDRGSQSSRDSTSRVSIGVNDPQMIISPPPAFRTSAAVAAGGQSRTEPLYAEVRDTEKFSWSILFGRKFLNGTSLVGRKIINSVYCVLNYIIILTH